MTLKIGQTMRDLTTGFTGIAINRSTMLNGTVQYNLQPRVKDDTYPDAISIDENLLETVDEGVSAKATPSTYTSNIRLGNTVKDLVTGIVGIATMSSEYLNGCTQFHVSHKGTMGAEVGVDLLTWIDQCRLEVVDKGIIDKVVMPPKAGNGKQPGGPVMRGIPRN